jgi:hypothetical protein
MLAANLTAEPSGHPLGCVGDGAHRRAFEATLETPCVQLDHGLGESSTQRSNGSHAFTLLL